MPCYDSRIDEDREKNIKKVHLLTRVSCDMAKLIIEAGLFEQLDDYSKKWFRQHEQEDRINRWNGD